MARYRGIENTAWMNEGECIGATQVFFEQSGEGNTERALRIAQAKEICGRCAVRAECLEYAINTGQNFGVWGGTTERERRTIKRSRRDLGETA